MKINKINAYKFWCECYGNELWAEDFGGGIMYRDAYGDPNAYFVNDRGQKNYCGWNLHHILPINRGGSNAKENLECTNIITNEIAGDKTTFVIDDIKYQVKKVKGSYDAYWIDTLN